jgi:lipid-A-disaccharide synthase
MTPDSLGRPASILLVVGETSSDRYGAALVRKLRAMSLGRPLTFFGTGGDEMKNAGVELFCHIRDLAGIGVRDAFRNLKTYLRVFEQLQQECRIRRPDVAVLLDFPEFNLRLAKRLKRLGIKVIYYISPQLWAWRGGRIKLVRKYVDFMMVILPFEEDFYRRRGVNAKFVGHPLLEDFSVACDRSGFLRSLGFNPEMPAVGILPGSRRGEVEYILPLFLETARLMLRHRPVQFAISVAPAIDSSQVSAIFNRIIAEGAERERFRMVSTAARTILANMDFSLVKCGTSTLEAALVGTPFLISYRVAAVNWMINKVMIRSRFKGLVNLIAEEEIVPEYLQGDATPERLSCIALDYLEKPEKAAAMKKRLATVREKLGSLCASDCTAALVAGCLDEKERCSCK